MIHEVVLSEGKSLDLAPHAGLLLCLLYRFDPWFVDLHLLLLLALSKILLLPVVPLDQLSRLNKQLAFSLWQQLHRVQPLQNIGAFEVAAHVVFHKGLRGELLVLYQGQSSNIF